MRWTAKRKKDRHRVYMRERYRKDAEFRTKHLARVKANNDRYDLESKKLIQEFKKDGCCFCSEKEPCCLSAHHVDPSQKEFAVSSHQWKSKSPKQVAAELKKCICVCENCHRKIHAGKLTVGSSNGRTRVSYT